MRWWGTVLLLAAVVLSACSSSDDSSSRAQSQESSESDQSAELSSEPDEASTTVTTAAPTTTTTEPPTPIRWLAVGDSYSSGEGLDDATGRCSRSPSAYPALAQAAVSRAAVGGASVEQFALTACTGTSSSAWPTQLEEWTYSEPNLISATFGGNDVGFVGLMADCIGLDDGMDLLEEAADLDFEGLAQELLGRGCDRPEDEINAEIDGLQAPLEVLYTDMAAAVGDDGRVFILGYPAPVADPDDWPQSRCDGVSRDDGRLLRRAADRLNDRIRTATEIDPNVHFVEVASAFDGHARCSEDPWLYGLGDGLEQVEGEDGMRLVVRARPFHPNASGHKAMAALLTTALSATSSSS